MKIPNPIVAVKRMWADPRKRPLVLASGGAAGALAYMTLRPPGGADAAAEETAAQAAAGPNSPDETLGTAPGAGMYGTYAIGGPMPMDYDPGLDEMDFTPFYDALSEQQEGLEQLVAEEVDVERKERTAAVRGIGKQQRQTQKKLDRTQKTLQKERQRNQRQAKTLRQQRRAIAKVRRRVSTGPKPKPRGGKQKGRR